MRARARARGAAFLLLLGLLGCGREETSESPAQARSGDAAPEPAVTLFVGSEVCAGCHAAEAERWRGSHHDLAMQEPEEGSVLGDFAGVRFEHGGVTTTFSRREGRFRVRTDGPDGSLHDYEVTWTFGVAPLQQYLIGFPDGRVQALGIAWDARPAADGGQRWFHLYPDEDLPPGDRLHWTGIDQNWNHMCAECHSTQVKKNYDPATDRFATTFEEIDVGCEACHGPGSVHVAWAEAGAGACDPGLVVRFDDEARWRFAPGAAVARREPPRRSHSELDTCARCHSRRATLSEEHVPGRSLLATHRPALLDEGLYHADGQILDEVYVWGSFLQSRMFAAGVSCGDCHDPHSLRLRAEGNALCSGCHAPAVFDTPDHHFHAADSVASTCVACHMPARVYMQVDPRRDHSFRVPRPDLSLELGTPNVCTGCHADRSDEWAARAVEGWYGAGRRAESHFARALAAGRRGDPGASRELIRLALDEGAPAIARATALHLLGRRPGAGATETLLRGLADPSPLVRLGAAQAAAALEPATRLRGVAPLLGDPLLALRLQATTTLADLPSPLWPPAERMRLAEAAAEYRSVQQRDADRPLAHLNLGLLDARFGELADARREYETALRLDPGFTPATVNLADVLRLEGRDAEAEPVLRRALERAPGDAALHHALGLLLVREARLAEALPELARAAALAPDEARFSYVHGVALDGAGETGRARDVLAQALERHSADLEILASLVALTRKQGALDAALGYARRLVEVAPDDPAAAALLREVEAELARSRDDDA